MSDELIPHVDEDGSTFFECELLVEAVSSASELEQSGLSLCCVSSIESMKEQFTASNFSSNEVVNETSNCVQSDSQLLDVSVSCSYHVVQWYCGGSLEMSLATQVQNLQISLPFL